MKLQIFKLSNYYYQWSSEKKLLTSIIDRHEQETLREQRREVKKYTMSAVLYDMNKAIVYCTASHTLTCKPHFDDCTALQLRTIRHARRCARKLSNEVFRAELRAFYTWITLHSSYCLVGNAERISYPTSEPDHFTNENKLWRSARFYFILISHLKEVIVPVEQIMNLSLIRRMKILN
jgi:hypothetical protein